MLAVAEAMFVSVLSVATRIHWKLVSPSVRKGFGNPSTSAMVPTVAVSVWPTCAVPVIAGAPVAEVLMTIAAATWKTPESPYMGWVEAGATTEPLPMGPWPVTEELGRPTRTLPWVHAERPRYVGTVESLGAVVVAAGEGVVG